MSKSSLSKTTICNRSLSFLLVEVGYTVQIAGSAEEALERLRSFSPDLILMDLDLPGMDGLQLTRVLRFDPVQGNYAHHRSHRLH